MNESDDRMVDHARQEPPRQRRLLLVELALGDGKRFEVIVRNISPRGMGASARGIAPAAGAIVTLAGDGEAYTGVIRWVSGQNFGVHFQCDLGKFLLDRARRPSDGAGGKHNWTMSKPYSVIQHVQDGVKKRLL